MEDLSLHILDIAENSIAAAARRIEIKIDEDRDKDLLTIEHQKDNSIYRFDTRETGRK